MRGKWIGTALLFFVALGGTAALMTMSVMAGHDMFKDSFAQKVARLIKCECKPCEYIVRAARKPIEALGAPICPGCGEQMTVAGADRDEGEGE